MSHRMSPEEDARTRSLVSYLPRPVPQRTHDHDHALDEFVLPTTAQLEHFFSDGPATEHAAGIDGNRAEGDGAGDGNNYAGDQPMGDERMRDESMDDESMGESSDEDEEMKTEPFREMMKVEPSREHVRGGTVDDPIDLTLDDNGNGTAFTTSTGHNARLPPALSGKKRARSLQYETGDFDIPRREDVDRTREEDGGRPNEAKRARGHVPAVSPSTPAHAMASCSRDAPSTDSVRHVASSQATPTREYVAANRDRSEHVASMTSPTPFELIVEDPITGVKKTIKTTL